VISTQATAASLNREQPIHFIGAGGVGMSALALILLAQGFHVSGSDREASPYLQKMKASGATVYIGHQAQQLPETALVIASTAIDENNPELLEARKRQLNVLHRSDLLQLVLRQFEKSIGLTGTHGKTSMTGMTGLIFEAAGLDPAIIAGGKIPGLNTNAKISQKRDWVVAELDESDGTVVKYQPTYSVIANLELDHPDHYQNGIDSVLETFAAYLQKLPAEAVVLLNQNCPNTRKLVGLGAAQVIGVYPDEPPNHPQGYWLEDVQLNEEGGYQATVKLSTESLGTIWLQVPGRYNLANALFSAALAHQCGISFDVIRRTLENFTGMGRRFERLGQYKEAWIVDDYAHHPSEVKVTLKAAQDLQPAGRVIALFQPHRYQRLASLWDDFLSAFEDADEVIVVDVFAAGDQPIEGVNSETFVRALQHPAAEYWPSPHWDLVLARLKTLLTPGDMLITLGAGDITQVGRLLVNAL
jgi:UDP-N-acetylmuramate--alanine ligase